MARKNDIAIFSVFGQIERCAATIFFERGDAQRIDVKDFPRGAPTVNEFGHKACFAVSMKASKQAAFDDLCAELRA